MVAEQELRNSAYEALARAESLRRGSPFAAESYLLMARAVIAGYMPNNPEAVDTLFAEAQVEMLLTEAAREAQ